MTRSLRPLIPLTVLLVAHFPNAHERNAGRAISITAQASLAGRVRSPRFGAITGVRVRIVSTGLSAWTDTAGHYLITSVPAGPATVVLSDLQPGCTDPGPQRPTVPAAGTITVNFRVKCLWPILNLTSIALLPWDTLNVVAEGDASWYRTEVMLTLKTNLSPTAMAAFFARHAMTVWGVTETGRFFVRIPDPGPTISDFNRAIDALRREPEIDLLSGIPHSGLTEVVNSHH